MHQAYKGRLVQLSVFTLHKGKLMNVLDSVGSVNIVILSLLVCLEKEIITLAVQSADTRLTKWL